MSANDPKRTSPPGLRLLGPHETRIDESPMEGQDFIARLTTEISALTSHHQPLWFSLRRGEGETGDFRHHRPQIGS